MKILFLDQNKWIELASVFSGKISSGPVFDTYENLLRASHKNEILAPLTPANIVETAKRGDLRSRSDVAIVQAQLSKGYVFRSRKARLTTEIRNALYLAFKKPTELLPRNWAIVPNFIRAFEEFDTATVAMTEQIDEHIAPADLYLNFILNQDDALRQLGKLRLSSEAGAFIARVEIRRAQFSKYPRDVRWRAYAVQALVDHLDFINRTLSQIGHSLAELEQDGREAYVQLFRNIPTLNVESELAVRLESQTGKLKINDLGDIENFYTSLPYADVMVAEKNFASLAKQAKLDMRYGVSIHTKLDALTI